MFPNLPLPSAYTSSILTGQHSILFLKCLCKSFTIRKSIVRRNLTYCMIRASQFPKCILHPHTLHILNFNMTYNTDATFDFDSKNIKLAYEGKEDDIVKSIEAGNVSMTTGSSLIRGSTALFGVKTKLQFGKLTATALVSQQNSESKTVNTKGGSQTTDFSVNADQYDQNRHFFLSQYFYENYDKFAARLPLVSSGINITRVEVWVTNKSGRYDQARNVVAFTDLGESTRLARSEEHTSELQSQR